MKKYFKWYLLVWIVCVVAFNVICFITPNSYTIPKEVDLLIYAKTGYYLGLAGVHYKYAGSFWAGYVAIMVSFVGNLICAYLSFSKPKTLKEQSYYFSLFRTALIGLLVSVIIAIIVMFVPDLPIWIGSAICIMIFIFFFIRVIGTLGAINIVSDIDEKDEIKLGYMNKLIAKSKILYDNSKNKRFGNVAKEVYETIRYSDPVSNEKLDEINNKISEKFDLYKKSLEADSDNTEAMSRELIELLQERRELCKIYK